MHRPFHSSENGLQGTPKSNPGGTKLKMTKGRHEWAGEGSSAHQPWGDVETPDVSHLASPFSAPSYPLPHPSTRGSRQYRRQLSFSQDPGNGWGWGRCSVALETQLIFAPNRRPCHPHDKEEH